MQLDGMEALQRALKAAPERAKALAGSAVERSAFAVASRARALVPVGKTGDLKASITATSRGLSGRAMTTVPYARYVEFGTRHMAAQPFFRPAAESESAEFIQRMRAIGPQLERDLSAGRFT